MKYCVIHVFNSSQCLENAVNKAIREGWTLQGGVSVASVDEETALVIQGTDDCFVNCGQFPEEGATPGKSIIVLSQAIVHSDNDAEFYWSHELG